jgi:aspartate racemase
MKTIGLLGGMSWESTELYYREINEGVKQALGGLHSAKIVMVSVDFHELELMLSNADWDGIAAVLSDAARKVELAGADFLVICTNTMHNVAPQIEQVINIPILHIADATAEAVKAAGIDNIGLLGTSFTMEKTFYRGRLAQVHGLTVNIPETGDRNTVNEVIFEELCLGQVKPSSRQEYLRIMDGLTGQGAEGVILGCTEITMLVKPEHTDIPLFDTTAIHATAAVKMALEQ